MSIFTLRIKKKTALSFEAFGKCSAFLRMRLRGGDCHRSHSPDLYCKNEIKLVSWCSPQDSAAG